MIKESGSPYDGLKNLKIIKMILNNKVLRFFVIILVWALAFVVQHLVMFHFDVGSYRSTLMLITGFISIPVCEWLMFYNDKKEDSKLVWFIKSMMVIALNVAMLWLCYRIGCPNPIATYISPVFFGLLK